MPTNLPAAPDPTPARLTPDARLAWQPFPPAPEDGVDWRRLVSAVLRYKWLVIAVTTLGTAAGVGATRFFKPEFVAQATVWIDRSQGRGGGSGAGPIRPEHLFDATAWVDLATSYVVLDHVVRERRLYVALETLSDTAAFVSFAVDDRFQPGAYSLTLDESRTRYTLARAKGTVVERGAVGDSVGRSVGFAWVPAWEAVAGRRAIDFTVVSPRDAAYELSDSLRVDIDPSGSLLRFELSGTNPASTAATVNALAERYAEVAAGLKRQRLTELTAILGEQLERSRTSLAEAEAALRDFGVRTITLPSDRGAAAGGDRTRHPRLSRYFEMTVDREELLRDREAIERALNGRADGGRLAQALEAIPSAQRDAALTQAMAELTRKQAELRTLGWRYTDAHPAVQRLRGEIEDLERETLPRLAGALVAELGAREPELDRVLASASRDLREIPSRAIEEARLARAVEIAVDLYTNLEQRHAAAQLAEASSVPDVRILDAAVVPQRPVRNPGLRIVMLALLGSLGCAVVGAVLLDRADPHVWYPEHVSRGMGLTILGALPHIARNSDSALSPAEMGPVVEALRGIRMNLLNSEPPPLALTVTSPGKGDGKSFVSSNLALTFAVGGHRTVLIDGDLRRGLLHRRLGGQRQPGLADYLHGDTTADALGQPTRYPNLTLIGCGTRTHRAPELLGSAGMARLLDHLRASFDVIVLDSPPLAAGVDPYLLASHTGRLALVLRARVSDRELARAKLEILDRLPIRLLGAILNDVPGGMIYRYYYTPYNYYLPGYEARDETEAWPGVLR